VDEEKRMTSCSMPILKAFDGLEPSKSRALMSIFVSKTRRNILCLYLVFPVKIMDGVIGRPPFDSAIIVRLMQGDPSNVVKNII